MSQEKFQQALSLFKAGNRKQASELLLEVVKSEPGNADAWYGLASCTDVIEKKKYYLQKVLEINPQHTKVLQLLEKINLENSANSSSPEKLLAHEEQYVYVSEKKVNSSTTNPATSMIIMALILCVAWLFYKVNNLEKSLAYVQAVAENADSYSHTHYSDSRLKKNISEIKDPLNGILSLHGVNFFWNTSDYPKLGLNNEPQIGFIAQELEQVYPELVNSDENGYKTVDYAKLIPVLVEAIKQQQLMISDLQHQVDNLEKNR